MKRFFPILLMLVFTAILSSAQSGGTSLDQHMDQLSRKIDRLAVRLESKFETAAGKIEGESDRLADKAEEIGDRLEDKWYSDWSIRLEKMGKNVDILPCPEVSYLGIETHEVSFEKAQKLGFENHFGSYVSKVLAASSGQKAGLQAFDYLYGVNDQRTSDNQNLSDILEDFEPGDEVTLHLIRKGEKMSLTVRLGDYDYGLAENEEAHPFLGVSPSDYEANELSGVAVDVVEKSTAEEMGLKVGDVITSINGYPVLDWEDVTTAIQNTRPGDAIEVSFLRDEKPLSAKGTIKSYQDVYPEDESGNWNLNIDWDEMDNVQIATGDDWEQGEEQDENRAFIGIYTEMISKEKAKKLGFDNPYGAYITGIIPNSGAEKAGLKPFDYIFGFDEYRAGAEQNLGVVMKKFKPGQTATVHYFRQGKPAKGTITFTRPYKIEKPTLNSCQDPFLGINQIEDNIEEGIVIKPVANSTAIDLGLKEGDILTHINGNRMVDWVDVATAVDLMNPGEAITVNFIRGDKQMKATKPIKSYAQSKNCADCDCGGKASVVVATVPGTGSGRGWPSTSATAPPTPRVNVGSVKSSIENLSANESNALKSKGVQISETSNLKVDNLQIAPNASTGLFDLTFNLTSKGNTSVRIYNPAGRMLYEYELGNFNGKFSDSVDISQNGIGNYFLEINQDGKVFTRKILLAKN